MERHWCVPGGRATRPTEINVPPLPTGTEVSPKTYSQISSSMWKTRNFKRAGRDRNTHLSPFSKTQENQCAWVRNSGSKHQKGRSYHKTITVVFSPCFLEKRNNQGPHSHNIGIDINEFGHRETAG